MIIFMNGLFFSCEDCIKLCLKFFLENHDVITK